MGMGHATNPAAKLHRQAGLARDLADHIAIRLLDEGARAGATMQPVHQIIAMNRQHRRLLG